MVVVAWTGIAIVAWFFVYCPLVSPPTTITTSTCFFIILDTFRLPFIRGDYCTGLVYNKNEGVGDYHTAWPGKSKCELSV